MGGNLGKELEKAKAKDVTEIDLKGRGITEITPNIGALESLIKLSLRFFTFTLSLFLLIINSTNKIKTLPPQVITLRLEIFLI